MKCLSLLQPFASALVSREAKDVENRPRVVFRIPEHAIGKWVGIHASLGWWPADVSPLWPVASRLVVDGKLVEPARDDLEFPRGVVLGAVRFDHVRKFTPVECFEGLPEAMFGRWAFGPVCYQRGPAWQVVARFQEPIPCKGMLGLWQPPAEISQALDDLTRERRRLYGGVL